MNQLLALTLALSLQPIQLDPVDQRTEDVCPLGASLRQMPPSLRDPNYFGELYRIRGNDDDLVRAQGGLYMVFQRSVYGEDKKGKLYVLFPPNTVFYIGPPPGWSVTAAMQAVARHEIADAGRIDTHLDLRVTPSPVTGKPDEKPARIRVSAAPPPGGIVRDAEYRARRLHALMAQAARGPSSSSSK